MIACDACLRRTGLIAAIAGRLQIEFKQRGAPGAGARAERRGPARGRRVGRHRGAATRTSTRRRRGRGRARPGSRRCAGARTSTRSGCATSRTRRRCCTSSVTRACSRTRKASASWAPGAPRRTGSMSRGRWAAACRRREITVVSGLAMGIDSAAHAGALEGPGRTIGVLAASAHIAYPARGLSPARRGRRPRRGHLRDAAGRERAPLVLRRPQPDHRRARGRDRRRPGHGALGLAHHRGLRRTSSAARSAPSRARSPPACPAAPTR